MERLKRGSGATHWSVIGWPHCAAEPMVTHVEVALHHWQTDRPVQLEQFVKALQASRQSPSARQHTQPATHHGGKEKKDMKW